MYVSGEIELNVNAGIRVIAFQNSITKILFNNEYPILNTNVLREDL